jgi:glycosyltransferase involved in cell wall biosynthesis
MKVLTIARDKNGKIFDKNSAVSERNVSYGELMQSLDIVVFTLKSQSFEKTKLSENVTVYPTNSASRWFFVWDAILLGKKIIRQDGFVRGDSVVTCQDPFECGFVGWCITRHFRLPLHLQIHTDFLSRYFQTTFFQRLRVWMARFLLPRADFIRVVSLRVAESLKNSGIKLKNPPRVLPIRIDFEKIISEKSDDDIAIDDKSNLKKLFPRFKFYILMASRLTEEKCVNDALSAFAKLVKKHSYAGLFIAGSGPMLASLEEKSRVLNISDNVVFLGERSDIVALMKSANIFLSTSLFEGYGMSVVEAGLSRLPVLSTGVGIAGEILVHMKNSYICPVHDISCIAQGIETIITDNSLRTVLAQNLFDDIYSRMSSREEYTKSYVALLKESSQNK